MKSIAIGEKIIGPGQPTFIIAEVGVNHNGDLEIAKQMIDLAQEAGVDAIKFQSFRAEEFVVESDNVTYTYYEGKNKERQITENMYDMFKRLELPIKWHQELFTYAKKKGLLVFSTAQDTLAADLLDELDVPCFKVGSDDLTNLPLLKYLAMKNKPIILSTGMSYISEIQDAVETIRQAGNEKIVLLHCISNYPTKPEDVNLNCMKTLGQLFSLPIGFSDHTEGSFIPTIAVALGACVIEKHFTLDKDMTGPDHWFSCDPKELKLMVKLIRQTEKSLGNGYKTVFSFEEEIYKLARRSVVAKMVIPEGSIITADMLTLKRPGTGIPPKMLELVIGRQARKDIQPNEIILWEHI